MYLPTHFAAGDPAHALAAMREAPFALIVSNGADAEPFATHAPLAVDSRADTTILAGHIAYANPHAALLALEPRVLVVFSGPHAYVTPARYTTREAVPTWNYVAVHCYGDVKLIEDEAGKDRVLKRLIADHDPDYAAQWRALDPAYQRQMLGGIVAFEIVVARIEAKFKLSQNRPAVDRERVREHQAAGSPGERSLAEWMRRLTPS